MNTRQSHLFDYLFHKQWCQDFSSWHWHFHWHEYLLLRNPFWPSDTLYSICSAFKTSENRREDHLWVKRGDILVTRVNVILYCKSELKSKKVRKNVWFLFWHTFRVLNPDTVYFIIVQYFHFIKWLGFCHLTKKLLTVLGHDL